jgi:hypothetical protein
MKYEDYREKVIEWKRSEKKSLEWCTAQGIAYETFRTWIKRVHICEGRGAIDKAAGTTERTAPKTYYEYRALVLVCRRSGLTAKEWCEENGYLYTTYCTWRKKVLRRENGDLFDAECGRTIRHGRQPEPKISNNPTLCELKRR